MLLFQNITLGQYQSLSYNFNTMSWKSHRHQRQQYKPQKNSANHTSPTRLHSLQKTIGLHEVQDVIGRVFISLVVTHRIHVFEIHDASLTHSVGDRLSLLEDTSANYFSHHFSHLCISSIIRHQRNSSNEPSLLTTSYSRFDTPRSCF